MAIYGLLQRARERVSKHANEMSTGKQATEYYATNVIKEKDEESLWGSHSVLCNQTSANFLHFHPIVR